MILEPDFDFHCSAQMDVTMLAGKVALLCCETDREHRVLMDRATHIPFGVIATRPENYRTTNAQMRAVLAGQLRVLVEALERNTPTTKETP